MSSIKILDTHTINKIAAGEVVERPASVVKELVENSIDAKASSITVEIKKGGIDLIRVTDNGIGIPKEEVEIAFLRHATSKITKADDLYKVISLGFRGEALASIAAVSHVELITKQEKELTGKRITVSAGKIEASEEIGCPSGTSFIVRHLFHNVPARKAFLGSVGTEAAKISDYMDKLALAHPEIAFKYIQNGKVIFTTTGDHELRHCVLNLYGKEYAKNTFNCYYELNGMKCVGLLGAPSLNRSNRNYEHFFINGRYIKSPIIQNAVEDAYKTLAMVGKFPFVILHLTLNPAVVDVNVHPTKLQVRFNNIDAIYNLVYEAVSHTLKNEYLVPEVDSSRPKEETRIKPILESKQLEQDTFFTPRKEQNEMTPATMLLGKEQEIEKVLPTTNPYKPSMQTIEKLFGPATQSEEENMGLTDEEVPKPIINYKEVTETIEDIKVEGIKDVNENYEKSFIDENEKNDNSEVVELTLPETYRIVGQIFKTYWLVEYQEKVFIIDQHAAHERILYERFMKYFKSGNISTQILLLPETLHVTQSEKVILEKEQELFNKLGFIYEAFGENAIAIREVPYILNEPLPVQSFKDVLDLLSEQKLEDITDLKIERIIKMSCRSAIKANDALTEDECKALIIELLNLENPFTCPHGRPTLISMTKKEIEKMFRRI